MIINMQRRYSILSVTVSLIVLLIIGSYLYLSQPPELKVQEGYETLHIPYYPSGAYYPHQATYAETIINGANILNFNVSVYKVDTGNLSRYNPYHEDHIVIFIEIAARTHFKDDLKIDYFELRAVELGGVNATDNTKLFWEGKTKGLLKWPDSKCNYGTWGMEPAYMGFNVNDKNFSVSDVEIYWEIPHHNYGNNYTLRVQAILGMYGQRIPATIDIELSGFAEGEEE